LCRVRLEERRELANSERIVVVEVGGKNEENNCGRTNIVVVWSDAHGPNAIAVRRFFCCKLFRPILA
jgi:hypothetical protein